MSKPWPKSKHPLAPGRERLSLRGRVFIKWMRHSLEAPKHTVDGLLPVSKLPIISDGPTLAELEKLNQQQCEDFARDPVNNKMRFDFVLTGTGEKSVRVFQGFSNGIVPNGIETICRKYAFHGTSLENARLIMGGDPGTRGLRSIKRDIHASQSINSATGYRPNSQVIIVIHCHKMEGKGLPMKVAANGVVLYCGTIPVEYLSIIPSPAFASNYGHAIPAECLECLPGAFYAAAP